jgi:hypothetical protein
MSPLLAKPKRRKLPFRKPVHLADVGAMNARLGPDQDVASSAPAIDERAERKRRGWRRHPPEQPFLLVIVDHDNRRFTVEGPMTDAEGCTREVIGARRAGRQITCRVEWGTPDDAAKQWKSRHGWQRWPSGSIVAPAQRDCTSHPHH